jgi:hypothetical protein
MKPGKRIDSLLVALRGSRAGARGYKGSRHGAGFPSAC